MQTILRTYFSDCTILTVAHRLKTIMDSDRILVMADGQILVCTAFHLRLFTLGVRMSFLVRVQTLNSLLVIRNLILQRRCWLILTACSSRWSMRLSYKMMMMKMMMSNYSYVYDIVRSTYTYMRYIVKILWNSYCKRTKVLYEMEYMHCDNKRTIRCNHIDILLCGKY